MERKGSFKLLFPTANFFHYRPLFAEERETDVAVFNAMFNKMYRHRQSNTELSQQQKFELNQGVKTTNIHKRESLPFKNKTTTSTQNFSNEELRLMLINEKQKDKKKQKQFGTLKEKTQSDELHAKQKMILEKLKEEDLQREKQKALLKQQ